MSKRFLQRERVPPFQDFNAYAFPAFWQIDTKGWSLAFIFELCELAFLPMADGPGVAPDSFSGAWT